MSDIRGLHEVIFGEPKQKRGMFFEDALVDLRHGRKRLTRHSWNAPGQYIAYQDGYPQGIEINANTAKATGLPEGTVCRFRPYLILRTADGSFVPWAPTVSDVLADDWAIVLDE